MTNQLEEWVTFELDLTPDVDGFGRRIEWARSEWRLGESAGPEAIGPLRVVGGLVVMLRHAPPRLRSDVQTRLDLFTEELRRAVSEMPDAFQRAVLATLASRIGVPETFVRELSEMSVSEIREAFSTEEIVGEILHFLDSGLFVLEGLKAIGQDDLARPFVTRLDRLRERWLSTAPKVAQALLQDIREHSFARRVEGELPGPPEFWWEHIFVDAVREQWTPRDLEP